jgi:O-antigen ligase
LLSRDSLLRHSAHISLTLIGLMWVLPFLYPGHAYPLTTFYQEWIAAVLGLTAALWLLHPGVWRQPEIPRIVWLPLGLLGLVLIQLLRGQLAYAGQARLWAEYLLWAALLMLLGYRLRQQFGWSVIAPVLAGFLLLGAELNALAGLIQHYHWHGLANGLVTSKMSVAVYGNLAQPNHFANLMALGLAALGGLGAIRRLSAWQVVVLALPMLFVMVLSGSRSSWLYLLALPLLAWRGRTSGPELGWLLRYSLCLLAGFALMHGVVKLPWFVTNDSGVTSFGRLYEEAGGNSIRILLWREALLIWLDFPWLGAGFGQFAWQHFTRLPTLGTTTVSGLYNNAHNLPLQLAAEGGLVALLLVVGLLLAWWRRTRRAAPSVWQWWGYAVCTVLGLHSLLEYPLWYAHFLGIAALMLGMLETGHYRLSLPRLWQGMVAATLAFGLFASGQLLTSYREFERLISQRPAEMNAAAQVRRQADGLNALTHQPELRPYVELYLNPMYPANEEYLEFKHSLNTRVLHALPIGQVAYREVLFLAYEGRIQEAKTLLEYAIWSYPGEYWELLGRLDELVRKDPAHYAALLEFALQKFEEYQRAISAG